MTDHLTTASRQMSDTDDKTGAVPGTGASPAAGQRNALHLQRPELQGDGTRAHHVEPLIEVDQLNVYYGSFHAVRDTRMTIGRKHISAMIGPSGCGKSTVLRCFNRMNDLIPGARVEGSVRYHDQDLYGPKVDPIEVRRRIGMVFQKPNPFPKSIYDNVIYGPRVTGMKLNKKTSDELVEVSLRGAALWDEVKDKLGESGLSLSGGQQQRLCIARAIATRPEVILMDEPCSALDPIATGKIEDLMQDLTAEYTIIIVTHNMQQAARVSDRTAFFTANVDDKGQRYGELVEFDLTSRIFTNPSDKRTEDYISGRFG